LLEVQVVAVSLEDQQHWFLRKKALVEEVIGAAAAALLAGSG
jgi:hypothetical protein